MTSPPSCSDFSSLMMCLLARGRDNLSLAGQHSNSEAQPPNQFPKDKSPVPHFFLIREAVSPEYIRQWGVIKDYRIFRFMLTLTLYPC